MATPDQIALAYADMVAAQNAAFVAYERLRALLAEQAGLGDGGPAALVMAMTARHYGFSPAALRSRDRHAELAVARMVAMWLCRKHTRYSLQDIGRLFERDHGTVIHAIRTVGNRLATEPAFAAGVLRQSAAIDDALRGAA